MKMGNAYTTTTDGLGHHGSDERSIYFERERCQKCNRNACFARVVEAQIAARRKSYGNFAIPGSIYFRPDIGTILTKSSPALNDDAPYNEKNDQPNYPFHHFGPTSVPPDTIAVGTEPTDPPIKRDGSPKPASFDSNANNDAARKKQSMQDNLNENKGNQRNLNSNRDNIKETSVPDQRRAGASTPAKRASNNERPTPRDTIPESQQFVNSGVGEETTFQGQIFGQGGGYETSEGQRQPSNPPRNDHLRAPDTSFELYDVPVDELANAGTSPSISRTNSNPSASPQSIPIISPLNVPITGNNPRPSPEGKLQDNAQQQNGSNVSGTDPRAHHTGLHDPKNGNRASETKSQGTPEISGYHEPPESSDGPSERLPSDSRKSSYHKQYDPRNRKLKQIQNRGLSFDDDDDDDDGNASLQPASGVQDVGPPQGLKETGIDNSSEPVVSVRDSDGVIFKNDGGAHLSNHPSSNDNNKIPSLRDHKADPAIGKVGGYENARQTDASVPGDKFNRNIEPNKASGLPGHSEGSGISGGVSHAENVYNGSLRPPRQSSGRVNSDSLRGIHENPVGNRAPDISALVSTGPEKSDQPAVKYASGNGTSVRKTLYGPSGSLNNLPVSGPTSIKDGAPDGSGLVSFGPDGSDQPEAEHEFGTGSHLRGNVDSPHGSINNSPLGASTSINVGAPGEADFVSSGPKKSGPPRGEPTIGNARPLRRNSNSPHGPQNGLPVGEPASAKDAPLSQSHLLTNGPPQPGRQTREHTTGSESPLKTNLEGPSGSVISSPVSEPATVKVVEPARVNFPSTGHNKSGQPAGEHITGTLSPLSGSPNNIPIDGPASLHGKTDPRDSPKRSSYPIQQNPQNEQVPQPVGTREEKNLNQSPTSGSHGSSGRSSYNNSGIPSTNFLTPKGMTTEIEPEKRSYFDTVSQRLPQSERPNSTRGDGVSMVTPQGSNSRDVYPRQNPGPIAAQQTSSSFLPGNPAEFVPEISADPNESHNAPLSPSSSTSRPSHDNSRVTESGNSPLSSVDASIYPIYDPENQLGSNSDNTNNSRQPQGSFKRDSAASSDSPQTGVTGAGPHKEKKVDQAVQDDGRAADAIDLDPDNQRYTPEKLGQSDSINPSVNLSGDIASSPNYAVVPTKSPNDSPGGPAKYFPLGSGPHALLNKIDTDSPLAPRQGKSDSKSPTSRSLGSADDGDSTAASLPTKDVDGGQHRPIDIRQPTKILGPLVPTKAQEAASTPESPTPDDPKLATRNGPENRISTPGDAVPSVPTPDSAKNHVDPPRKSLATEGEELSKLEHPDSTATGRTIPNNKFTIGQPDGAIHRDAEPRIGVQLEQPIAPKVSSVNKKGQSSPSTIQTVKNPSHDPPRASNDLTSAGRNLSSVIAESLNPLDNSSPSNGPKRRTPRNDKNGSEHPQGPQSDKIFDEDKQRDAAESVIDPGITLASVGEIPDKRPDSSKSESTAHSKEGNRHHSDRPTPRGPSSSPLDQPNEFPYESAIGPGLVFEHPTTTGITTNETKTEELTTGTPPPPAARPHVPEGEEKKVIGRTPEEPERSPPGGKAKIPAERPLTSHDKTSARPYVRARPNTQPKLKSCGPSATTLDPKKNFITKLQRPSDKLLRLNHPDNAGCLVKLDNMIAYNKSTKKPIKKSLKMTDFIRVVDSGRGKCLRPQSMRSIESDAELMTCPSSKKREPSCAPWPTAFTIIYPSSSAHCPPGTIRRKDGFFAVPKKGAHRKGKWYQQEDESKRRQCSLSKEYKPSGGTCSSSRRAVQQTNVQKSCGEVNGNVRPTKKLGDVELRKVKRPQALKPPVLEYEKLPSGLQDSFKNLQNELDQYVQVCHQVNENLNDQNHTPRLGPTDPAWSPIKLTPRKRKHDECNLMRNPPLICPDPNPCCLESYCPCNPCRPQECCYNNVQCVPCVPMAYSVCSAEQMQANNAAASQISTTKEDDKIDALVQETLSNAEIGLTRALGSRTSLTHTTTSDGATDLSEWMNRLRARLATGMTPLEIKGSRCSSDDDVTASALHNIGKEKTNKPSGSELNAIAPEEREENLQNVLQGIDHVLRSPNTSPQSSILNMTSLSDATVAAAENDSLQIGGFLSEELRPMSDESSYASLVPSDCVTPVPRAIGSSNNSRPVRVRFSNPIVQEYWTPDSSLDSIGILVAEVDSNDNYSFLDDGNEMLGQEYNEAVMENV